MTQEYELVDVNGGIQKVSVEPATGVRLPCNNAIIIIKLKTHKLFSDYNCWNGNETEVK